MVGAVGLVDGLPTGVVAGRAGDEAGVEDVGNPPREGLVGPKPVLFEPRGYVVAAGRQGQRRRGIGGGRVAERAVGKAGRR
jgi:hypothetical protein